METLQQRYAHWQSIMDRYERSGLKQHEFCRANTIDFEKFKYFRGQLSAQARLKEKRQKHSIEPTLAPVILKKPEETRKLVIKHPSGIECQIPCDISDAVLLRLIKGLLTC